MARRIFLGWALTILCAGCALDPFACATQSRFLDAHGELSGADPAHSGSAAVSFLQFRGGDQQRSLTWFIRGSLDVGQVSAVHLHHGYTGQTGDILFAFSGGYSGPADVITQSGPQLWMGTLDYEQLFNDIRVGGVYVDVHTVDQPDGALRGQLSVTNERGWQDACT